MVINQILEEEVKYLSGEHYSHDKPHEGQFGEKVVIQRCTWHKRENILSYLSEGLHEEIKKEYHQALSEKTYDNSKMAMEQLIKKLKVINLQADRSLEEGLEEL